MKEKLLNKLPLLLMSLGLSIFLWFMITNQINPIEENSTIIDIKFKNANVISQLNKNVSVLGSTTCKISYKVSKNNSQNVRRSDFEVYVDYNELLSDETKTTLPIHFNITNNATYDFIDDIKIEPSTINIKLNDNSRKEVPVKYRGMLGNPDDDHIIGNVILSPNVVYVSGNDEVIQNIESIQIDIPMQRHGEKFSGTTSNFHVVDKDGKEIVGEDIDIGVSEIAYTVIMYTQKTINDIRVNIEGNVKNGYTYTGMQITPNNITIEGPKEVIDTMSYIQIPESINIDELSENYEQSFMISQILPQGIRCNNADILTVRIMVNNNIIPTQKQNKTGPADDLIEEGETSESAEIVIGRRNINSTGIIDNIKPTATTESSESINETEESKIENGENKTE